MADKDHPKDLKDHLEKHVPFVNKEFSRRNFLRGSALATAGTIASTTGLLASPLEDDGLEIKGPDEIPIELKINKQTISVLARPDETLADVLRDRLELTGTKIVCGRGACSACTVLLDKKPVCSCLTLAVEAQDNQITTIEGIADGDQLHPVQEAFIEEDASMCGYCTPGMVMSCVALLDRNPNPDMHEIKHAVRGNLCRCGTYPHVFNAAKAASGKV